MSDGQKFKAKSLVSKPASNWKRPALITAGCLGFLILVGGVGVAWLEHRQTEVRRAELRSEWKASQGNAELQEQARAAIAAQQEAEREKKDKRGFDAEEIRAFKDVISELDPTEALINEISIENGRGLVDVVVTPLAYKQSDLELKEFGTNMQNAASKICECSPIVRFRTASGKTVIIVNAFGYSIREKNR
ncbi:hypothetical protein SPB21_07700 [Leptothoe sp. ISB3NOV94-8A]|nr:hypothetical protein [Leptothoe sp. LEGE 181152]